MKVRKGEEGRWTLIVVDMSASGQDTSGGDGE